MAQQLFISMNDLKRYSVISGNIDDDKLVQFAKIAHDIHLQNYLGTDLFVRLKAGITAADLSAAETALLNDYVKPMAIHWTLVEVLSFSAYTVSNKGIFKHRSEDSESVDKEEVDWLVNKHRDLAENYTQRFIDYMCYNSSSFSQYTSNTDNDISPDKKAYRTGWVL